MRLDGVVDETLHLGPMRHIGLHDGVVPERKLFGERLKPVEAPCAQHEFRSVLRQAARGRFSEPAAALR